MYVPDDRKKTFISFIIYGYYADFKSVDITGKKRTQKKLFAKKLLQVSIV